jgi:tetratricopeptide (TPR) repeat protein
MAADERKREISADDVKAALESLIQRDKPFPSVNALLSCHIVDEFLLQPDLPPIARAREFAVHQLLTDFITYEYAAQRSRFGLDDRLSLLTTRGQAEEAIRQDASAASSYLRGWSLFYYHYVRVDLNFSPEDLAGLMGVVTRTLRRDRHLVVKLLTRLVIQSEWETRRSQRQRRLYAQLPSPRPVTMFGRDDLLNEVAHKIFTQQASRILITGAVGIGKTLFAQELMRQVIDHDADLANLIWLHQPVTLDAIQRCLKTLYPYQAISVPLRQYLMTHRTAVVIDGLETLTDDPKQIDRFLEQAQPAVVCMTSRQRVDLLNVDVRIDLSDLPVSAARQLAEQFAMKPLTQEEIDAITHWVGGSPYGIQLAVMHIMNQGTSKPAEKILPVMLDQEADTLSVDAQQAWLAAALMPDGQIRLAELAEIWPSVIRFETIAPLINRHLLYRGTDDTLYIAAASCHYLKDRCRADPNWAGLLDNLLNAMTPAISASPARLVGWYARIIEADWPVTEEVEQDWITRLIEAGVEQTSGAWGMLLRHYAGRGSSHNGAVAIAYAALLRRQGQWREAETLLHQVIDRAGRSAEFVLQSQAMIELGVLYRWKGDLSASTRILSRAMHALARHHTVELSHLARLELAQNALDAGDPAAAGNYLSSVSQTTRWHMLIAESYFQRGSYQESLNAAENALHHSASRRSHLGRIHTLMGRCYEKLGKHRPAHRHFLQAMMYLEEVDEPLALHRARANLAAALMHLGDHSEAEKLLRSVEQGQQRLNDTVGLAATRRNLDLLARLDRNPPH